MNKAQLNQITTLASMCLQHSIRYVLIKDNQIAKKLLLTYQSKYYFTIIMILGCAPL